MRSVVIEPRFESWRDAARRLLAERVPPDEILWSDNAQDASLFTPDAPASDIPNAAATRVPRAFLDIARSVSAHRDPRRWSLLYQMLWRLTHGGEQRLLAIPTDPDLRQIQLWSKAVGRDIHKMHAFVRFRLIATDEATGREQFVAWFEPEHCIVRLASAFFRKRFVNMNWSILTPDECAHWDGATLSFTPGVLRDAAPDDDALDDLWRTYYRSIFNPARLKVKAMQSEMPKKYWKNLPEAPLIEGMIADSRNRVRRMLDTEERPVKAPPQNAYLDSLRRLNDETTNSSGKIQRGQ